MNLFTLFIFSVVIALNQQDAEGASRHRDGSRRKSKVPASSSSSANSPSSGDDSSSTPIINIATGEIEEPGAKRRNGGGKRRNRKNRNRHRGGGVAEPMSPVDDKNVLKTIARAKFITESRLLKSDWCKSQPVRQTIRTKNGCKGSVINHFCYGQCNSFYIPKDLTVDSKDTSDAGAGVDYFKSCSYCKPKSESWVSVRLKCKSHPGRKRAKHITKKIKRVDGCTCVSVNLDSSPAPPAPAQPKSSPVLTESTVLSTSATPTEILISEDNISP